MGLLAAAGGQGGGVMSGLREALLSALNAHGEATLDNGARVRVLPEAVLRDVLALQSPVVSASRERVAEVLARQFAEEDTQTDFFDNCSEVEQRAMVRAMDSFAGALLAAGVFRDEATVKAEALEEAARQIVAPGGTVSAADWLQAQATLIRHGVQ